MKDSYIFLADGFEEIEAISTLDIMKRGGMTVKSVSITNSPQVEGAHRITVNADIVFGDCNFNDAQWLILPGGLPGADNLAACDPLCDLLVHHNSKRGKIAALCASPAVVLAPLGILDGREAICYPGFEGKMNKCRCGYKPVIIDNNIITANGPAASMQFALAILSQTVGEEKAREIAEAVLLYPQQHQYYF